MVITSYCWTPCSNDHQILVFYKNIASRTSFPIMVFNNPTFTQVDMGIELLSRLVEIDNVISIKETSPYIVKFEPLRNGELKGKFLNCEEFEKAIKIYYEMQGWDQKGVPTRGKLGELDLEWIKFD